MSAFQTSTPLSLFNGIHTNQVELRPFETEFSEKVRKSMDRLGQELQQLSLRYILTTVDKYNGIATPPHYHPGSIRNGDNDQGIGTDPVDVGENMSGNKEEGGRHTKNDPEDDEARSQNDGSEGHGHNGVEGGVGEEGDDDDQQASGDDQDDEDFSDNEENEDDAVDEDDEEDEPDPKFPPRCRTTPPPIPGPAEQPSENGEKGHKVKPNVQPIAWENQAGATLCFPCTRSYGIFHPWFEFRVDDKTGRVIGDCDNHPKGQPEKSKDKVAKLNQYWPYFTKSKAKKPQQEKKRGKAAKKRAAASSEDGETSPSPPGPSKGKGAGGSSKSAKKKSKK